MPPQLVSKPFVMDPVRIPETQKILNQIKLLKYSIPTEREMAFLSETNSDDAEKVSAYIIAIQRKIYELQQELDTTHLQSKSKSDREVVSRSKRLFQQKQDRRLLDWIDDESNALDRLAQLKSATLNSIQDRKSLKEARLSTAKSIRDSSLENRLAKLQSKNELWKIKVEQMETEKESEAMKRSKDIAQSRNQRRLTQAVADNLAQKSSLDCSNDKEISLMHRLSQVERRRQFVSETRYRDLRDFHTRYPVHTAEVLQEKEGNALEKVAASDERVTLSRQRRDEELVARRHKVQNTTVERISAALRRANELSAVVQQRRLEKNENLERRFQMLREMEREREEKIEKERLAHSLELSFQTSGSAGGSVGSTDDEISRQQQQTIVADRLLSRVLKVATLHGISVGHSSSSNHHSTEQA